MGMPAAFTKLGKPRNGNIYIGKILHKTFISVDVLGTKSGAATGVDLRAVGSSLETVKLNRPFVYAIIDNNTNLPVFMGQ